MEFDSGVPAAQQSNWRLWNDFRAAGSEAGPPIWKADLGFGEPALCLDACTTEGHALLWRPVQNSGLVDAGAFSVILTVERWGSGIDLATETFPGLARVPTWCSAPGPWTTPSGTPAASPPPWTPRTPWWNGAASTRT